MSIMCEQVTRETELRKLSYNQLHQIASHMNHGRNWQQLMMRIPKDLQATGCSATTPSDTLTLGSSKVFKYTNEHMQLIEEASGRSLKLPAHILFEEWGTSGRHRPTVGHLLRLLIEADLYRAADFVSTDILKEDPAPRPGSGPAAPIDIDLSMLEGSLDSINLNIQSVTFNGSSPQPPPRMNSSSTNGQIAAITDLFDNEAMVTADENSNAPTLSTNLESDPIIEGLSGVSLPNLSILNNAALIAQDQITSSEPSFTSYPLPDSSILNTESMASEYQSNVPNMSLFGGMNFATTTAASSNPSTSDSSSSVSLRSDLSASFGNNNSSMNNHSLPQLSFLMNNAQMAESSSSLQSSSYIPQIDSGVEKFNFAHLLNCTNHFNEDDFTAINAAGRKLGAGGFGSVHLGVNLAAHISLAAVKRLHKKEQVKQKFDLEIRILSSHRHENLVQLLGYADDASEMCLVYEFVAGGNLERRLELCRNDKATLTIEKRLTIAVGVARAIDFLHRAELIHRDIKSANVLLNGADHPKLCDFGLLRPLNSRTTTMAVGSSGYMAPEIVRGTYDFNKVDIFAFGVLQLELLTGLAVISAERREDLVTYVERRAGNAGDITGLLDRKAGGEWGDLGQRWFNEVVIKALELSPNKRSDIDECLKNLHQLCNIQLD